MPEGITQPKAAMVVVKQRRCHGMSSFTLGGSVRTVTRTMTMIAGQVRQSTDSMIRGNCVPGLEDAGLKLAALHNPPTGGQGRTPHLLPVPFRHLDSGC